MMHKDQQEPLPVTTLLVVDDEAAILEATAWALRNAGCRSYSAGSLEAALTILASHSAVSGVIVDRGLVGTALATALARIREVAPHVVIVGTSGSDCQAEFLDAGADHFLAKPWTTNQVMAIFGAGRLMSESDQA